MYSISCYIHIISGHGQCQIYNYGRPPHSGNYYIIEKLIRRPKSPKLPLDLTEAMGIASTKLVLWPYECVGAQ